MIETIKNLFKSIIKQFQDTMFEQFQDKPITNNNAEEEYNPENFNIDPDNEYVERSTSTTMFDEDDTKITTRLIHELDEWGFMDITTIIFKTFIDGTKTTYTTLSREDYSDSTVTFTKVLVEENINGLKTTTTTAVKKDECRIEINRTITTVVENEDGTETTTEYPTTILMVNEEDVIPSL